MSAIFDIALSLVTAYCVLKARCGHRGLACGDRGPERTRSRPDRRSPR